MPLNIDFQQILLHFLNFVILFAALYFILYSPVKKFIDAREESYKKAAEKAAENKKAAEDALSTLDEKLSEREAEAKHERDEMLKSAGEQAKKIVADAKAEADEIIEKARADAEALKKKAIADSREDLTEIAVSSVEVAVMAGGVDEAFESFLEAAEKGK